VKRFARHGCPGAYLRVLEEGLVRAGDAVLVVHRPAGGPTIGEVFREEMPVAD
jgi:MOSC domain-containing protein YiiM